MSKVEVRPDVGLSVWGPKKARDRAEWSATQMVKVLASVYGQHNLMARPDAVREQILSERVKPWLAVDQMTGEVTACAALVDQGGEVEIGRVANRVPDGRGGGELMKRAVKWHLDHDVRPLVAEVRLAREFAGIAGGQASQHILLTKFGVRPRAVMPAFHHPGPDGPDRQELFCLAGLGQRWTELGRDQIDLPKKVFSEFGREIGWLLTGNNIPMARWSDTAVASLPQPARMVENGADTQALSRQRFVVDDSGPFHVLHLSDDGDDWTRTKTRLQQGRARFVMVVVESDQPTSVEWHRWWWREGFCPLGISESGAGLVWGILGPEVVLAPSLPASGLPGPLVSLISKIDARLCQRRLV